MDDPSYIRYAKTYRRERLKSCAKAIGLGIAGYVIFAWVLFPFGACGCKNLGVARRASCASNYKQLGLSLLQYAQDNDGNSPMAADPHSSQTWRETLYPYVKSSAIYICPEDRRDYSHASPDQLPVSYGANVIKGRRGMFASPGSKPIRYTDAARTITLIDMRGYQGPEWSMIDAAFLPTTGRELYAHKPYQSLFEHPAGQYNCFFADGHVKFLRPLDTLTPVNLWTRDNRPFTGQELSNAQAILRHAEAE